MPDVSFFKCTVSILKFSNDRALLTLLIFSRIWSWKCLCWSVSRRPHFSAFVIILQEIIAYSCVKTKAYDHNDIGNKTNFQKNSLWNLWLWKRNKIWENKNCFDSFICFVWQRKIYILVGKHYKHVYMFLKYCVLGFVCFLSTFCTKCTKRKIII